METDIAAETTAVAPATSTLLVRPFARPTLDQILV